MSSKPRLKKQLREAAAHISNGFPAKARTLLESLQSDPAIHELGQRTSLGLPRQLQSVWLKLAKAEKDRVRSIGYQYHLVPESRLLSACAQFTSDEKKTMSEANRQAVPRRIHQIWIGEKPLPDGVNAWIRHAKNQGYEHQLWREAELHQLGIDHHPVYAAMLEKGDLPGAVDVARYLILQQQGGIYLDCDWYPARNDLSFHDVLPLLGMTAMAEPTPRNTGKDSLLLANSMIAAPPQHPVFARLLGSLSTCMRDLPEAPAWWSTGPLIFTLVCRGGAVTLADADLVAGSLPQSTALHEVDAWCKASQDQDAGLLLSWKSWIW